MPSDAFSIRARNSASRRLSSASARFRSVMSRAMVDAPVTAPDASRMGETVSETARWTPSLATRSVSRVSTASPLATACRMSCSSSRRSRGTNVEMWRPIISSAVYP